MRRMSKKKFAGSGGDCYEAAAKYVIENSILGSKKNLKLVHGEVAGQGELDGVNFGHAWVLDGNKVIDKSNGGNLVLPKSAYYDLGKIDEIGNIHVYTPEQMRDKLLKFGHYGPWELKTSTGL
jgi:hypothetical protein